MPHFAGPTLLSNNISKAAPHNGDKKYENGTVNKSTPKECEVSQNNTTCRTKEAKEVTVSPLKSNNRKSCDNPEANSSAKIQVQAQQKQIQPQQTQHGITNQKPHSTTLSELKEVQSFGSVDLIPVSNTAKQDPKVHEKPVKNFVEITPLISAQNDDISKKSDDAPAHVPVVSTCNEGKIVSLFIVLNCC